MRLEADRASVREVAAFLTLQELAELRDACEELIRHFDEPGWHVHVSAADFQTEMTLAAETNVS